VNSPSESSWWLQAYGAYERSRLSKTSDRHGWPAQHLQTAWLFDDPEGSRMKWPTECHSPPDSRVTASSRLGSIIDAAGAKSPMRSVMQQAAPSAPLTEPTDLVARALTIFSEEVAAWEARRAANNSRGATP
jgi:hypothetical protein